MARSFIIDDFHWMLNVFHCKHFLAFLHIFGDLISYLCYSSISPKKVSFVHPKYIYFLSIRILKLCLALRI